MKRVKQWVLVLLTAMFLMMTAAFFSAAQPLPEMTGDQRADMIAVVQSQLGTSEDANGNTVYSLWNNQARQPWSAAFISWCARHAGLPCSVLKNSQRPETNFSAFNLGRFSDGDVQPGDLYFDKASTRVGLVIAAQGDFFSGIEGDVSTEEGPDAVALRTYRIDDYDFSCPNYGTYPVQTQQAVTEDAAVDSAASQAAGAEHGNPGTENLALAVLGGSSIPMAVDGLMCLFSMFEDAPLNIELFTNRKNRRSL